MQSSLGSAGVLLGYHAPLLEGERGTAQTVQLMRRLIDQALSSASFVRFAIDLVRSVPAYDEYGELDAVFCWVQDSIRYTKDPVTKEKLTPPEELLKLRAGDCDDISMLLAALVIAIGYPARLVTVAADPNAPKEFSHVYAEAECPPGSGQWIAIDAARPNSSLGLQPPVYFRKKSWSLVDNSTEETEGATRMRGLSGYMTGLGDWSSVDWTPIIQQTIAETPQLVAISQGQPTQVKMPTGTSISTGNPYASFMSPYTPGYAVPAAGYGVLPAVSSSIFSSALPWLAIGLVAIFAFRKSS